MAASLALALLFGTAVGCAAARSWTLVLCFRLGATESRTRHVAAEFAALKAGRERWTSPEVLRRLWLRHTEIQQ